MIGVNEVVSTVNNYLAEITAENPSFLTELWRDVDAAISLARCHCFCLPIADDIHPLALAEDDGLGGTPLWSFIFLFCNKDLKRICLFTCYASTAARNTAIDAMDIDGDDDEDMDLQNSDYEDDGMDLSSGSGDEEYL
jgi:hypothetical protein